MTYTAFIFDLDGTVIDSSHRQLALANGDLDLSHWKENSTPEMIFRDRLLPLANVMQTLVAGGKHMVAVCTSRVITPADREFLFHHGMYPGVFMHRQAGDNTPDGLFKRRLIRSFLSEYSLHGKTLFWEDNLSVHEALRHTAIDILHPDAYNRRALKVA